jgi:DNA (cytosine-5)-methyltransferase 1
MEVIGSIYTDIKSSIAAREYKEPRSVMEVIQIGSIAEEKNFSNPQTGGIYAVGGCSPTLSTMQGGGQEPKILESQIVAMRGRNPDNPSDRSAGSPTKQRLEVNTQGTSNCLTSVHKDNLVMENVIAIDEQNMSAKSDVFGTLTTDGSSPKHNNRVAIKQNTTGKYIYPKYRIRKLTPRECGRLMGVSDEDISKMAAVNSDSQLYKQFGNSIVVDIMCAMFKNLNIKQGE